MDEGSLRELLDVLTEKQLFRLTLPEELNVLATLIHDTTYSLDLVRYDDKLHCLTLVTGHSRLRPKIGWIGGLLPLPWIKREWQSRIRINFFDVDMYTLEVKYRWTTAEISHIDATESQVTVCGFPVTLRITTRRPPIAQAIALPKEDWQVCL